LREPGSLALNGVFGGRSARRLGLACFWSESGEPAPVTILGEDKLDTMTQDGLYRRDVY